MVASTGQPYAYANGDPVNLSDPSGLHPAYDNDEPGQTQAQMADYGAILVAQSEGINSKAAQRARAKAAAKNAAIPQAAIRAAADAAKATAAAFASSSSGAIINWDAASLDTSTVGSATYLPASTSSDGSGPSGWIIGLQIASLIPVGLGNLFGVSEEGPDEAEAAWIASDFAADTAGTSSTVYRAVESGELADISETGAYRVPEGIGDGKYFYPTQEQAANFVG